MALPKLTTWTLQSPDGVIWTPAVTTTGVVTFTSGGTLLTPIPVFQDANDANLVWVPSINTQGVVTLTSATIQPTMYSAALLDAAGIVWEFTVSAGQAILTSASLAQVTVSRLGNLGESDNYGWKFVYILTSAVPNGDALALPEWNVVTLAVLFTGTTMGGSTVALQTAPENTNADFSTCNSAATNLPMALSGTPPFSAVAIERSTFMRPALTVPGNGAMVVCEVTVMRTSKLRR